MEAETAERRLAAILSADVVGFSRLMAEDEAATLRTLTVYREEIGLLVRQHRGRVVDAPGDNLLAEDLITRLSMRREPQFSLDTLRARLSGANRDFVERYVEGFHKAGLKE